MSESTDASAAAGIDLSQFHQVFFEEAGENLQLMEQLLLDIDIESADDEVLNAIFRCAHSVKGGAATFGFADVAELTHQMETLLDKLRRRELAPSAAMVDVLLQAGDALKSQLAWHRGDGSEAPDCALLLQSLRALAGPGGPREATHTATPRHEVAALAAPGRRLLELTIGPLADGETADGVVELFGEIADIGTIEPLDGGSGSDGLRRFKLSTGCSDGELLDLFSFHVDSSRVRLAPLAAAPVRTAGRSMAGAADAGTLRVAVDKVDQLINLVGELVITQAMLAQRSAALEPAAQLQLSAALADLQRHTRNLQESVMSIRMIPMSTVFSRFPRMLRDLAAKLGKQVELVTLGEATELDKGMIEKITDPLTHLVRNSCDHGIELPAERAACGKRETGTVTLAASHQGGSIVIEVRDDGKGLNRQKLLQKAREKGIDAPDSMSDNEVWNLIFAPGFSTAEVVTDVSGRGVGMDVVKKNITALGGSVDIDSADGHGMSVKVRLPLTLAIMDGMSVGIGDECYILPLGSVVESFQVKDGMIRTIGGTGRVVEVRQEYMPVIDLEKVFDVPRNDVEQASNIMVVVEAEGQRVALLVDELLGQQQVVVKNLEANYRKVPDVSGATIMGDGRVALILDIGALVRRSRH